MITWRDDKYEYSTDGKEVWKVCRNFKREVQEAKDAESRRQVMLFNVRTRLIVLTLLSICVITLVMALIMAVITLIGGL